MYQRASLCSSMDIVSLHISLLLSTPSREGASSYVSGLKVRELAAAAEKWALVCNESVKRAVSRYSLDTGDCSNPAAGTCGPQLLRRSPSTLLSCPASSSLSIDFDEYKM